MYVPQLPTDNLYKFQALGGIALAIATMWLASDQLAKLDTKVEQTEMSAAEIRVKYEILSRLRSRYAELADSSVSEANQLVQRLERSKAPDLALLKIARRKVEEGRAFASEGEKVLGEISELQMDAEKAKIRGEHAERWAQGFRVDFFSLAFLSFVGLTYAMSGFVRWQRRVQNYQDLIVKAQAEQMTARPAAIAGPEESTP